VPRPEGDRPVKAVSGREQRWASAVYWGKPSWESLARPIDGSALVAVANVLGSASVQGMSPVDNGARVANDRTPSLRARRRRVRLDEPVPGRSRHGFAGAFVGGGASAATLLDKFISLAVLGGSAEFQLSVIAGIGVLAGISGAVAIAATLRCYD
jgi:hypothetical protein